MLSSSPLAPNVVDLFLNTPSADASSQLWGYHGNADQLLFPWVRLYCDPDASLARRSCQTVLEKILDGVSRSIAPVLPHLAEEAYAHSPGRDGTHLTPPPSLLGVSVRLKPLCLQES